MIQKSIVTQLIQPKGLRKTDVEVRAIDLALRKKTSSSTELQPEMELA